MYDPAAQVQVLTDASLGSYYLKNQTAVGGFPHRFPFKKKDFSLPVQRTGILSSNLYLIIKAETFLFLPTLFWSNLPLTVRRYYIRCHRRVKLN